LVRILLPFTFVAQPSISSLEEAAVRRAKDSQMSKTKHQRVDGVEIGVVNRNPIAKKMHTY
jgi:hypothetical protein